MAQEKRPRVAKRVIDETAETVTFIFGNGKTLIASLADITAVAVRNSLNGLSQKIGDAFASAKGNADTAYQLACGTYEHLKAGEWNERGEGVEETPGMTIAAVAKVFNKDVAKVQAGWSKLSDEQRKALKANANVKAEVARVRAERAAAKAAATVTTAVDVAVFD